MFRKPKNKSAIRQRTSSVTEEGDGGDEVSRVIPPPSSQKATSTVSTVDDPDNCPPVHKSKSTGLLSFEHEEEGGEEFTIKKNKKRLKDAKRLRKLEQKSKEMEIINIKQEPEDEELQITVMGKDGVKKKEECGADENVLYHDLQRSGREKDRQRKFKNEEDIIAERLKREQDADEVHQKFPSVFSGIPDSKAVYEARKRRERMRQQGYDGYIPLDDDQKLREKGVRDRLIREDENDDSDEDNEKFYSSRALAIEEENRRREQQSQFLEKEQGDHARCSDDENDRWEEQQISKAVGASTIGQMRHEYERSAQLFRMRKEEDDERHRPVEMDIDMDVEDEVHVAAGVGIAGRNAPGASHVTMEDIMAKLSLRLRDREESLNSLRLSVEKIQTNIDENKEAIRKMECAGPVLAEKFKMYQMMKMYVRSLLDCLNEKVGDINTLIDRRRHLEKARMERLTRRRRRDVRDAYDECSAAAKGKNAALLRVGDHGIRAAERDARRGRRRRQREGQLAGISHEGGLSSDDEETTSQTVADKEASDEIDGAMKTVFVDALEDYSSLRKVLDHMIDWLSVDGKSFEDAYVHLSIPKLSSPYVRLQLSQADVLKDASFRLDQQEWYRDVLLAGETAEVESEHQIVIGLVPSIVEKVVVPFLTDVVNEEWDPLSLRQTKNLATLIGTLVAEYPTMTERSKPVSRLVEAIQRRAKECTDEDLFTPMFSKQAIENANTGCRAFLDRQFWTAVKLVRSLSLLSCMLAPRLMSQMVFEGIASRTCALALQMGDMKEQSAVNKVRALIGEIRAEWIPLIGENSTRTLISVFTKVADEHETKNKDFAKETRQFIEKLKKRQ